MKRKITAKRIIPQATPRYNFYGETVKITNIGSQYISYRHIGSERVYKVQKPYFIKNSKIIA